MSEETKNAEEKEVVIDLDVKEEEGSKKVEEKVEEEKLLAGKFKDVESLENSYKELEKKVRGKPDFKDKTPDEISAYFKKEFGDMRGESDLEDVLGEISNKLSADTGLPAKLVDYITTIASEKVSTKQSEVNKVKAANYLRDEETKLNFVKGLEATNESKEAWLTKLNKGEVPIQVITSFAELGKVKPEGSIKEVVDKDGTTFEGAYAEIMKLTRVDTAYWKEQHPQHKKVRARVSYLRQRFNL